MSSSPVSVQRVAPSSLTQPGAQSDGSCPSCGSTRFTSLSMILTDGTAADFLSCHTCEHRAWTADGETLSFRDVLRRTTKAKAASA